MNWKYIFTTFLLLFAFFTFFQRNAECEQPEAERVSFPENMEKENIESKTLDIESADIPFSSELFSVDSSFPDNSEDSSIDSSLPMEGLSGIASVVDSDSSVKIENGDVPEENHSQKELGARENSWGTFAPGSWIQKRTITVDLRGKTSRSSTESTTTLESIRGDCILLREDIAMNMSGTKVAGEPQRRKYDFFLQPKIEGVRVRNLPPEILEIGRRSVHCEVRVYEQNSPQSKRRTKVWYNPSLAPYVLCTETIKTTVPSPDHPKDKEKILSRSKSIVLDPPITTLRGRFLGHYRVKTVRKNGEGTSISFANHSKWIPGGLRNECTWEYDPENNLIRKSETYVVVYSYCMPPEDHPKVVELADSRSQ